ncbi:hypothetical protein ABPG74_019042 [Tetrahymena malaccensis]
MFSDQEKEKNANMISQLLETIDIFGVGINIRFNHQNQHKTRFGGFITLVLSLLLITLFVSSILSFVYKTNPQVIFQQNYVSNPSRFNLTNDNFSFVIALLDSSFNPIMDKSIFRIEGSFLYKETQLNSDGSEGTPIFKSKVIQFELCTEQSFQVKGTESYFLNLKYQSMYCFKNISDFYLVGQFEMNEFSVIQINVIPCDQSDPNNQVQCMEESKKNEIISNSQLQVYYINYVVQIKDLNKPFMPIGITQFWESNINFLQNVDLKFIKTYVNDDDGIILENSIQNSSLLFSSERATMSSKKNFSIYQISLYLEKNREQTYTRRYQRIYESFSSIGGIYNVLFAIGCILVQPYSQIQLNRKLFNATFQISKDFKDNKLKDSQNTNKKDINKQASCNAQENNGEFVCKRSKYKIQKLEKANKLFQNSPDENLNEKNQVKNNKTFKENFKQKLIGLKIKTKQHLAQYFSCFKIFKCDMTEIFNFGTNQILKYTDICFIVNKLIEFEKLKALLLNEQQTQLFNYIPKPLISINLIRELQQNQQQKRAHHNRLTDQLNQMDNNQTQGRNQNKLNQQFTILSIQTKSTYEKAKQAQLAFNQIYKDQQKQSKIDLKLIQLLDQELIELFDSNAFQENNLLGSVILFNQQVSNSQYKHNLLYSPISSRRGRFLSCKTPNQFSDFLNSNQGQNSKQCDGEDIFSSEELTETQSRMKPYSPRIKNFIELTNYRNKVKQKENINSTSQKLEIQTIQKEIFKKNEKFS